MVRGLTMFGWAVCFVWEFGLDDFEIVSRLFEIKVLEDSWIIRFQPLF